jgi:hypothetical protein
MSTVLQEVVSLRRAAGKLAPSKYFYYRLWDPLRLGKQALLRRKAGPAPDAYRLR